MVFDETVIYTYISVTCLQTDVRGTVYSTEKSLIIHHKISQKKILELVTNKVIIYTRELEKVEYVHPDLKTPKKVYKS